MPPWPTRSSPSARTWASIRCPAPAQIAVLAKIGPIFVASGDVKTQAEIDAALGSLINAAFITNADPSRFE